VDVTLKKYWVRVSGHLDTQGAELPRQIAVTIDGEDQTTAKRNQKISLKLSIADDGTFTATKRIKKNIPAGTVQTITAAPSGADLPAGAEVWLCIDIAEKKGDLAPASECHGGNTGGTPPAGVRVVEILDDAFEPKTLRITAGDTVRWVLRGSRNNHTTTNLEMSWDSGRVFLAQGNFFEHTFDASTDGQIFLYYCVTHRDCCEMQGSVLVGNTGAPPPGY
jgi:plastocyanin